ncbi:MAG: histidine phosphatase family protein [Acetobacteraceae bacterium]
MIVLRHGESEFNRHFSATRRDPGIHDPALTPDGHAQAEHAAAALAAAAISHIIVSPYTRALETAVPLSRRLGVPVAVRDLVRERFAFACDIGSPRSLLQARWPAHDFSALAEIWWPEQAESREAAMSRAARFRSEMAAHTGSEQCLVISHWGFILALTGRSVPNGEWLTCDPRVEPPSAIVWKP